MGSKEYYQKNKEKILAQQKKKREENIDEARRKRREYYHKNSKTQKARMKAYHEKNREELLKKQKEYREKNIDELRKKEREYKRTFNGIMTRRISSWTHQSGLKETPERKVLIFYRWYYSQKCELCLQPYKNKHQRCMEHHHASGHFRSICCGNCNAYIGKIDRQKQSVLLELHRYFHRI
jgi:hypothetical protein